MKKIFCILTIILVFFCSAIPQYSKAASYPQQFASLAEDNYLLDKKGYVWDANKGINKMERVKRLSNIKMVSSISEHFYALTKDGKVYYANKYLPDYEYKTNPTYIKRMTNLPRLIQIQDTGSSTFLGLDSKGNVSSYRHNDGKVIDIYKKATNVKKILYRNSVYIAYLKKDHSLWIENLLHDERYMGLKPDKATKLLSNVKDISGGLSILALKNDGTVWEAGNTRYSQKKSSTNKFVRVQGLKNIKRVIVSEATNYAINTNNDIFAWGGNSTGQFGNGTYKGGWQAIDFYYYMYGYMPYPNIKPILSMKGKSFINIAEVSDTSVGLDYRGNLWSWGLSDKEREDNEWVYYVSSDEVKDWNKLHQSGGYHKSLKSPVLHPLLPKLVKLK